jgi:hypothetical protein
MRPDVTVRNEGSIFLFTALTKRARDWVSFNVQLESYMSLGDGVFACEHRYAKDISDGMQDAGLQVI